MTIQDANYLLGVAEANYGYAFRNMDNDQKVMLVHSWAFGLQDIPADIVMLAFMQLTTTCDWLPKVKDIREQVRNLRIEAKEYFSFLKSQKDLAEMLGNTWTQPALTREDALKKYIIDSTESLEKTTEISLNTAMNGSYAVEIGNGRMRFTEIGPGGNSHLPPSGRRS